MSRCLGVLASNSPYWSPGVKIAAKLLEHIQANLGSWLAGVLKYAVNFIGLLRYFLSTCCVVGMIAAMLPSPIIAWLRLLASASVRFVIDMIVLALCRLVRPQLTCSMGSCCAEGVIT